MPLDREVDIGPGDIVLRGDPAPPKGHSPQFLAHICCGQTAGWSKMPHGMEVGFGPGHIVLDGNQMPLKRGTAPQLLGSCLLWPNGWMDQDATWYEGRHRPRPHCVTWGSSFPHNWGTAPNFRPCMSIVAKRSPISGAAEQLSLVQHSSLQASLYLQRAALFKIASSHGDLGPTNI